MAGRILRGSRTPGIDNSERDTGVDHVDAGGSVNDCRGIAVTGIWGYEQIVEFRKRIGQGRSLCECGCESVAGLTPGAGAW